MHRQPNRLVGEREREARKAAEARGEPRPISTVGNGRGGALMAFTTATSTASGR